jgi:hypothetical protein
MSDIANFVVETFDILVDSGLSKDQVDQAMFDILVSMEHNNIVDGDHEFNDSFDHDEDLDVILYRYLDSIENPDEYEEFEEDDE